MSRPHRLALVLALVAAVPGCGSSVETVPPASSAATTPTQHAAEPAATSAPPRPSLVGEGTLEVAREKAGATRLALARLSVEAVTTGDVAEVTVEHVFRNDGDEQLEGTFRFPVPEGAILTGLAMEIEGRLMEGELVEREKARKTYESIVDEMRDPALLEWEAGRIFKLRVFPIEARSTKRVVLRLIAPLHRAPDGLHFVVPPPTEGGALVLERHVLKVDGRVIAKETTRAPSGELLVRVADRAPEALVERTTAGTYLVAHVEPTFAGAPPATPATGQALIVVCDRSRSMLEERALQTGTAGMLLAALSPRDRFAVVTGDVKARSADGLLHQPTEAERAAALRFVDEVTPDGASDIGAMLAVAGDRAAQARTAGLDPVVVYLGDATPTWGETRADALESMARDTLAGAPLHVVVLGASADDAMARALTGATRGRLLRPRTEPEAARAAADVVGARTARRIDDVRLVSDAGVDVPLPLPTTIHEGDAVTLAAFVPAGTAASGLKVVGTRGGAPWETAFTLDRATPARGVARRWARARIERLEQEGDARKEDVVATSLAHGVMSRFTSFLVLESEEAYARHQIARKAKATADGDVRVTGRDLDGSGDTRTASVSPDHLQPGDPEVRIPAPRDAASVVIVFPFGETKAAAFEDDADGGAWVARFLVDARTPDGAYTIVVRITHADGRVEIVELPYVVDTIAPTLDVDVRADGRGRFAIEATQRLTEAEIDALAPGSSGSLAERRRRHANTLTDASRVEVHAPDGQVLALTHVRLGRFTGTWRPRDPAAAGGRLRLVVVDRALNQRLLDVEVP